MRKGSWRWWFESRETGEITIAQFPNWPLWCIGADNVVFALAKDELLVHELRMSGRDWKDPLPHHSSPMMYYRGGALIIHHVWMNLMRLGGPSSFNTS